MAERLLTAKQASEMLGVTAKSLANSRYTGTKGIQVPYIKMGRIIRYKESEVKAYIENNTINHTGDSKEDKWVFTQVVLTTKTYKNLIQITREVNMKRNSKNPLSPQKPTKGYPHKDTKYYKIVEHFMSGKSLNRFEAEKLGDHCLNSTVYSLCQDYGLQIPRKYEKVTNRFGGTSKVKRYWFSKTDTLKMSLIKP